MGGFINRKKQQMRHLIRLILLILPFATQAKPPLNEDPMSLTVACINHPACVFTGKALPIIVTLENMSATDVEVAVAFIQMVGPYIRLTDTVTQTSTSVATRRAPLNLLEKFQGIPKGGAIKFPAVIPAEDIKAFRNEFVDLDVEVIISSRIRLKTAETQKLRAQGHFRIQGEDTVAGKKRKYQ